MIATMEITDLRTGLYAWLAICIVSGATARADDASTAPDYAEHIAPIFAKYCLGCHAADGPEAGLDLESHAAALRGSEQRPVIVAGDATSSLLIQVLDGRAEPAMPPEGSEAPTEDEIALLRAWIDAGAENSSEGEPLRRLTDVPRVELTAAPRRPIFALAYSPDGKWLAEAGYREVRLLDAASRGLVRRFEDHANNVAQVSFSADGAWLVAAAGEPGLYGEARLWDASNGTLIRTFEGHRDSLYTAVLSPDAKWLATAGYDHQIIVWDVTTGEAVRTLDGHNGAVFDLAFSPDGTLLASASADRTVKLWDVAAGERLDTFGQPLEEQFTVAFRPDGRFIAAAGADKRIRVWQLSESRLEGTNPLVYARFGHGGAILDLQYSADGQTLVSSAEDRTVKVWNAEAMEERFVLSDQSDWPSALAIAPDGKTLAVGRMDGSLAIYDPAQGKPVAPPRPELARVAPRGLQRGVATTVELTGKNLLAAERLEFARGSFEVQLKPDESGERLIAQLTPGDDVARGVYEFAVVTPGGTSEKQKLFVDELPQVVEQEPNDAIVPEAEALTLPCNVWGTLSQRGDTDCFAFTANEGQHLVVELSGASIGGKIDAVLTLFDEQGRIVASRSDFNGQDDPLVDFAVPATGRYVVRVSDLMQNGSADHGYRLTVGELPFVTGVYPLSVPAGDEARVQLTGFNLPADSEIVLATAGKQGSIAVPLASELRHRTVPQVVVGEWPEAVEAEPNDTPETATAIAAPATVGGRIWSQSSATADDVDLFRFEASAGQAWVIETDAARRGSPIDTKIEVLDAEGQPVERLLLQATRDSYIEFRGIDSQTVDVRVKNWEEMELNQYLYQAGEVNRLFRLPRGPDSGFHLYGWQGKRIGYFDTTPTTHPLHEPCYIVEPHPPGAQLVPTGLPVFTLHYANDDDGRRQLGRDSRLLFTAPVDGSYLVRVSDVRGAGGDRFAYRLTVRPPQPDFHVTANLSNASVSPESGRNVSIVVDRRDGFDGPVEVHFSDVPPGFTLSGPVTVEAGHFQADAVLYATAEAAAPAEDAKIKVRATATIDGATVAKDLPPLAGMGLASRGKLRVRLEPAELSLAPGETITATLRVERDGFDGLVNFDVNNLPHGVIVDNIGLNGVLIPEGATERQIFLTARDWVPESTRAVHALATNAGGEASPSIVLHVRHPSTVAQADE